MQGPFQYKIKLKYYLPDELPATKEDYPEYFLRRWWIKVTANLKMATNISVYFPVRILVSPGAS